MKRIIVLFNVIAGSHPYLFFFMILTIFIEGVFAAFSTLSIAPIIENIVGDESKNLSEISINIGNAVEYIGLTPSLGLYIAIFFGLNVVRNLVSILTQYLILKIKYKIVKKLILDTFDSFFNARWIFFSSTGQGKLLNTFFKEISNVGDSFSSLARLGATMLQIFIYLAIPFWVDWRITIVGLVTAAVLSAPIFAMSRYSYKFGKRNTETTNHFTGMIQESITCAKIILGFGIQEENSKRVSKSFEKHIQATIPSQMLGVVSGKLYEPLGLASVIAALFIGQYYGVSLGELAVVIWSLMRILPLIGNIIQGRLLIDNFFPSYEQMNNLREVAEKYRQNVKGITFSNLGNEIRISDLNYSYRNNLLTLKDINIRIPKGKITAFVGESGSGKSTLIDCILGFHEPDSGSITVNDLLLEDYNIVSYRRQIGYVPQDAVLFDMSIRENLLCVNKDASDEQLWEVCRKANAEEFISNLPDKFDTEIGSRGVKLSGGQCQRLALARALLRNPVLLILDEATSAIDTKSEKLIQESIKNIAKDTTVVMIAHRLTTVRDAAYIYVLHNGEIIEEGSYKCLLNNDGVFKGMVDMQNFDGETT